MSVRFNPEYLKAIEPMLPALANAQKPAVHDVATRRVEVKNLLETLWSQLPVPSDVEIKVYHAKAEDGHEIPIYHYRKPNLESQGPEPAILHTHGGGYIALDVSAYNTLNAATASATGVQFFSVDYRLAPEHAYPVPIEDCYSGLLWVKEHAAEFNIDPARIAVYGDSAGGGLAAALAIMARDRKLSPPLAKQVLIYPMIDDRNLEVSPINDFLTWNSVDNVTGWVAYVGENAGKGDTPPHAAPARVESVEGLPSTYLDVGTLDYFRDENIAYVSRLAAANVEVEFHLYPGVPHAFEAFAPTTQIVKKAQENRVRALTSF